MSLLQPSPSNSFFEPPKPSEALPTRAWFQRDGSSDWILATSGAEDGVLVADESGNWVLVDIETPTVIDADGSDYGFGTTDAIAQLVEDDDGNVTLGTDFTEQPIAILGQDSAGNVLMIRTGQTQLRFLAVSGNYIGYEEIS